MPSHVSRALEYEVRGWGRLYECLQDFRHADPSARDVATYTRHVQAFLAIQQDLLLAEEEMLGSCLVRHYESLADELRDRGLRVPL